MGIIDARKTVVLGLSVPSWKLPLLGIEVHKIIFIIKLLSRIIKLKKNLGGGGGGWWLGGGLLNVT